MGMWFSISLPVPGSPKAFPAHPWMVPLAFVLNLATKVLQFHLQPSCPAPPSLPLTSSSFTYNIISHHSPISKSSLGILNTRSATLSSPSPPGIDEMPKSEIEKRKRNMESIFQISRREKRNVEICFLIWEENEKFCKKRSRILQFSPISRREREILKTNLMIREEIETSRF